MSSSLFFLFPVLLILYEFCCNVSNDMYLPAFPLIARDFTVHLHVVQLTIVSWLAGNTSMQLIVGPLSDRYGRRTVLLTGGGLFVLSTLGCALAPSVLILVIVRFFQGIAVCTMMVASYASIHDLYDDQRAIRILVWMGSAAVIAPAIGPVLGSLILLITGWRVIFWILAILSACAVTALWFCMPETIEEPHEMKIKMILTRYYRIFTNRRFMISSASFGLLYGGVMGWITAAPFLLMESLKLSSQLFGYLQIPIFGAYILGARFVKYVLDKLGPETALLWGGGISVCAGAALVFFAAIAPSYTERISRVGIFQNRRPFFEFPKSARC